MGLISVVTVRPAAGRAILQLSFRLPDTSSDVYKRQAETYPGATLPNAMVQLSPVTQFRSGAGYQYEDTVIYGFSHTAKAVSYPHLDVYKRQLYQLSFENGSCKS